MKIKAKWIVIASIAILAMLSACSNPSTQTAVNEKESAEFSEVTLTVMNPHGHVKKDKVLAPRLDSLEGKKVAMWLTATSEELYAGKGAELYDLLEKKLRDKYSNIQIVRYADLPMKYSPQDEVADAIINTRPDALVAGFGG